MLEDMESVELALFADMLIRACTLKGRYCTCLHRSSRILLLVVCRRLVVVAQHSVQILKRRRSKETTTTQYRQLKICTIIPPLLETVTMTARHETKRKTEKAGHTTGGGSGVDILVAG